MKNKQQLIIIRGMPASGKSTLARSLVNQLKKRGKTSLLILDEFKWVQVAHDNRTSEDFKLALDNYLFCLNNLLKHGFTVVTEDTFLPLGKDSSTSIAKVSQVGRKLGVPTKEFLLKVDLDVALARNNNRPMVVPKSQMKLSHKMIYSKTHLNEITLDGNLPTQENLTIIKPYL